MQALACPWGHMRTHAHTPQPSSDLVVQDDDVVRVCIEPSVHGLADAADLLQRRGVQVGPAKLQDLRPREKTKPWGASQQPGQTPKPDLGYCPASQLVGRLRVEDKANSKDRRPWAWSQLCIDSLWGPGKARSLNQPQFPHMC